MRSCDRVRRSACGRPVASVDRGGCSSGFRPSPRARMRSSRSRRLSRRTTASTTSIPPLGLASACSSSGRRGDPEVRRAGGGAEARQVDAVRRAEQPVVAVGVLRRALLEHREDRAAVVVDDHDGEVGLGLAGPAHQAVAVVEERHVAEQGEAAVGRAGRGRRRPRSTRRRRCRTGRGWRSPCGGRRPGSAAPSGRGRGSGWRHRRRAARSGGSARATAPATSYGVRSGSAASSASRPRPTRRPPRASAANQSVVVGRRRPRRGRTCRSTG